jgi:hypothetical protein
MMHQLNLGDIGPGESVTNDADPFEFEIPTVYVPRTDSLFVEFIWNGGADIDTQVVQKVIGGRPVLLVNDDGESSYEFYYQEYLDAKRIPNEIRGSGLGKGMLTDYETIIWFTGDYRPDALDIIETANLKTFLNSGGTLFLSGQGIAAQVNNEDQDFLHNYLKCQYVSSTYMPILASASGGQIFGEADSVLIFGSGGADNQTNLDQVEAINGGIGEMNYRAMPTFGAVSYSGDYRTLFFSYGFEAIIKGSSRWTDRDTIYAAVLDFLGVQTPGAAPTVSGLMVTAGDQTHVTDHTPDITWAFSDQGTNPQVTFQVQATSDKFWQIIDLWDSGPCSGSECMALYDGLDLQDGEEYYIRVRAANASYWSEWQSGQFRMNSVPTPTNLTPDNMVRINDISPELSHSTCNDAEGDSLTYAYEVYDDSLMTILLLSMDNQPRGVGDITSWIVPMELPTDEDYYWRVRSSDLCEAGEWSELASFFVTSYVCGDANADDQVNVGDAVFVINYVFKSGPGPDPIEAGDANCDDQCNVGDAVYVINFVFKSGAAPCAECP